MPGCCMKDAKHREIGEMFVFKKLDILTLRETNLKGWGELEFVMVCVRKLGVKESWAREGLALLLSNRLAGSVTEWKEGSSILVWVTVKLGIELWAFESSSGPSSKRKMRV